MDNALTSVAFAAGAHTADAVRRAAYALMARADIEIQVGEQTVNCLVRPLGSQEGATLVRDLRREVLDHELRLEIEAKTEPLRNMILGLAFSKINPNG